ncbi:pickpocket protein 28-like [Culex pipiens pallens]|uniref:pickpocket protein 28-like n=1 Tax=Culex pipiens pallens TaxID=42434 RepID=UPI001952EAA3|nr:pickpocket protein 28-like [Culex pipiens pallens]
MLHYRAKRTPIRRILWEYCAENFVQAIKFLADHQLLKIEKLWWTAWIVAAFVGSCCCVVTMYHKWEADPVVLAYAPRFVPISTIPFPAITVCPLSKTRVEEFNLTRALELVDRGIKLDEESERKLRSLAHVCPLTDGWTKFDQKLPKEDLVKTLRRMSLGRGLTVPLITWRTKLISSSDWITETLVDDGICYTFNALPAAQLYRVGEISPDFLNLSGGAGSASNWTRDTGYSREQVGADTYPKRSLRNGFESGFAMMVALRRIDQEYVCRGFTGFKVSVHPPDETAFTGDQFYRLNTLHALSVLLQPEVTDISKALRNISPKRRNCFFADERYLRYYNVYNFNNRVDECMSNLTYAKCGCVKFSMPRAAGMKVCDAGRIGCYRNTVLEVYNKAIKASLENRSLPCTCRQECIVLRYHVDINRFPFNVQHFRDVAGPFMDWFKGRDISVIQVAFKHRHYLPVWRRELLGFTDVVAKFGGLFALLMGASMLSLAEICYYACVRPLRRERSSVQWIPVRPWME